MQKSLTCALGAILILVAGCGSGYGSGAGSCAFTGAVTGAFIDNNFNNYGANAAYGACAGSSTGGTAAQVSSFSLLNVNTSGNVKMIALAYQNLPQGQTVSNYDVIVTVTNGANSSTSWSSAAGDCKMTLTSNVADSSSMNTTWGTGSVTCSAALTSSGNANLTLSSFSFTGMIPY